MALKLAVPLPKGAEYIADLVERIGPKYGISPYLLLGVCYAESNFGASLRPPGPQGTGDFLPRPATSDRDQRMRTFPLPGVERKNLPGGIPARKILGAVDAWVPTHTGWGCGLMQFDYEAHYEFCKSGAWKEPARVMEQAAYLLASNRRSISNKMPALNGQPLEQAIIAAYNAGARRVTQFILENRPIEQATFSLGYVQKICDKADQLAGKSFSYASNEGKV